MRVRTAAVLASVLALAPVFVGCGVGPFRGPDLPVYNPNSQAGPKGPDIPKIPEFAVPKADLNWQDCGARAFSTFSLGTPAPGVVLECATFAVASKERRGPTMTVSAARLRTSRTKPDAAPVVLTTGVDVPSTRYLAMFAAASPDSPLTEHPIVAVDRRGLNSTPPVNCGPDGAQARRQILDQMQFHGGDGLGELAEKARQYIGDCPQSMAVEPGGYDVRHAEDDIDGLRNLWQVQRLALIGVGDGANIALTYVHDHTGQVARIVLDSPPPYGADAEVVAEQRAAGLERTLGAFIAQCRALDCALGPNPAQALQNLLDQAGSGSLRPVSKSLLIEHIATALALGPAGQPEAVKALASQLHDLGGLAAALGATTAERFTDGQLIGGCNDHQGQPTTDRVRELAEAWAKPDKYPLVGDVVAKSLLQCVGWPTGQALEAPKSFAVPVLALYTQNNPVVASSDPGPIKALANLANAQLGIVTWEGIGYSALLRSRCADDTAERYLNTAVLEAPELYCPA